MLNLRKNFIKLKEEMYHIIQRFLPKNPFKKEETVAPPFSYKGVEHELSDLNYFRALQDYDVFWCKYILAKLTFIGYFFEFLKYFWIFLKKFFYYFSIGFCFFFFLFDELFHILPPYVIEIF